MSSGTTFIIYTTDQRAWDLADDSSAWKYYRGKRHTDSSVVRPLELWIYKTALLQNDFRNGRGLGYKKALVRSNLKKIGG